MNKKELIELVEAFRERKVSSVKEIQGKEALRMKNDYINHLPGIKTFQVAYEAFDSALVAISGQIPEVAQDRYCGVFEFVDHHKFTGSALDKVMNGIRFSRIVEFQTMYETHSEEINAINTEYAKVQAHCKTLRDGKVVREYLIGIGFDIPEDTVAQLPAPPVDTSKLF